MAAWNIAMVLLLCAGAPVTAATDGAQLYATHCAVCHGDEGAGGTGVPLSLPSFLAAVDDDFLHKTIRYGRPGRVMPAFAMLSEAQVDAIVRHIRGWSDVPAPQFAKTRVKGDVARGGRLYGEHCARCHGENGEGGEGTGVTMSRPRDMPIIAPALNNRGFLAAASDQQIRYTLEHGLDGTPMPSFREKGFTDEDIDDVVAFVRSYGQRGPSETATVGPGPVLVAESPYSLEETVENIRQAIVNQNFVHIRTEYLEHGLVPAGEEDIREVILHFCNFRFLDEALKIDPRIGLFLPCRVTAVEREGSVSVMSINPLYLSILFNNAELDEACGKMHRLYRAILEESTL
jgi:cytochrome c oxidase cbb3-type subunit 3